MEKKSQKKEIRKVAEKKINIDYILFIKKLINSKIEVTQKNKESIERIYKEVVNLKFNNLPRVANRIDRKEIKSKKTEILAKNKLSEKDYNSINQLVILLSKQKKNNYF